MRLPNRAAAVAVAVAALASQARGQPAMSVGGVIRDAGTSYTFSRETQGKVVFVDGTWWGVFGGTTGLDFYKWDPASNSWTKPTFSGSHITSDADSRADVHWDGANLEVLYTVGAGSGTGAIYLAAFRYTRPTFAAYSGFPVLVVSGRAVNKNWSITEDTNGRLWMSYQTTAQYAVIATTGTTPAGWTSFTSPVLMGDASTGIDGDLGSHGIVAFGGKVGLAWTECFNPPNNHTKFRWRSDSNADLSASAWSSVELCQEDATYDRLTDDHLCVRSFEGQVWIVSKTNYGTTDDGFPRFTLLRRDTSGNWMHWTVKTITGTDYSTRPVLSIDATNRVIYCIWHNSGIQYDTTSLDNPGTFSSIQTMIIESGTDCCWDSDTAQAPCDANSGLMVIADRNCDGWTLFRHMSLGTPTTGPLATITVTPNPGATTTGGQVQFTASGKDANGNAVTFTPTWSATGGTITSSGLYTAGSSAGTFTVTASSGSVSGSATVNVTQPQQQTLTSIVVTPNPASTTTGGTVTFTAQAKDQNGNAMSGVTFTWSATGGTITSSGVYTAGSTTGTFSVTATSGSVSGSASVTVSAPSSGGTDVVVDNDTAGFSILSGSWSVHFSPSHYGPNNRNLDSGTGSCQWTTPLPPGNYDVFAWWPSRYAPSSVTYTIATTNGNVSVTVDQSVSSTWGVWNKLGTYSIGSTGTITITGTITTGDNVSADAVRFVSSGGTTNGGGSTPVLTTIAVTPNPASVATGGTQLFTAQGKDQYGNPMSAQFSWSATGGTIDQSGNYTAGPTAGQFQVTATSGSVSGSAVVNVTASPPPQQVLTTIVVAPNLASTTPGGTVAFTAQARDQNGNAMSGVTFTWATSGGTIDQSGHYTAPLGTGSFDVSASSQGVTGHATVNVSSALATVIVDDSDPGWSVVSGTWNHHYNPGYYGAGDHVIADGTTGACQWQPSLASGTYDVYVWVPSRYPYPSALAVYTITTANGNVNVQLDQTNQSIWGTWTKIGSWSLNGGTVLVALTANSGQSVAADAVKFVQTGP